MNKLNEKSAAALAPIADEELGAVAGASGPSYLSLFFSPVAQGNLATVVQIAQGNLGSVSQGAMVVQGNSIG